MYYAVLPKRLELSLLLSFCAVWYILFLSQVCLAKRRNTMAIYSLGAYVDWEKNPSNESVMISEKNYFFFNACKSQIDRENHENYQWFPMVRYINATYFEA